MKKIISIIIIFILISCAPIANNQPLKKISMAIIGYSIETLIERYGEPDSHYINRETCNKFFIYGNKSVQIGNGIVQDVRVIH